VLSARFRSRLVRVASGKPKREPRVSSENPRREPGDHADGQ
jgi:hypothetical protein